MILLSEGLSPVLAGGNVKAMEDCSEDKFGSLWKETLERPFSIVKVVRCETLVRLGS